MAQPGLSHRGEAFTDQSRPDSTSMLLRNAKSICPDHNIELIFCPQSSAATIPKWKLDFLNWHQLNNHLLGSVGTVQSCFSSNVNLYLSSTARLYFGGWATSYLCLTRGLQRRRCMEFMFAESSLSADWTAKLAFALSLSLSSLLTTDVTRHTILNNKH